VPESYKPIFKVAGEKLEGNWENTMLHFHEEVAFDHITVRQEKAGMMLTYLIFRPQVKDFDDVCEQLVEDKYPMIYRPEPTIQTEQAFRDRFVKDIEQIPLEWTYTDEDKWYGI